MPSKTVTHYSCVIIGSCTNGKPEIQLGEKVKLSLNGSDALWPEYVIAILSARTARDGGRDYTFQYDDAQLNGGAPLDNDSIEAIDNYCLPQELQDHVIAEKDAAGNTTIHNFDGTDVVIPVGGGGTADSLLRADLDAEILARQTADTEEATIRSSADTTLQSSFTAEVERATVAETNLQTMVESEVSRSTAAESVLAAGIADESTARTTRDDDLQAQINTLEAQPDADTFVATFTYDGAVNQFSITLNNGTVLSIPAAVVTAAPGTGTTAIASTEFVKNAIDALVNGAPGTLDTINEIAAALGENPDFATDIIALLATKADKSIAITGAGLATGGGDLSENRSITVTECYSHEVIDGTRSDVVVTPRRLKTWWDDIKTKVQTISGSWTFSGEPRSSVPLSGNDLQIPNVEQVKALLSSESPVAPFITPRETMKFFGDANMNFVVKSKMRGVVYRSLTDSESFCVTPPDESTDDISFSGHTEIWVRGSNETYGFGQEPDGSNPYAITELVCMSASLVHVSNNSELQKIEVKWGTFLTVFADNCPMLTDVTVNGIGLESIVILLKSLVRNGALNGTCNLVRSYNFSPGASEILVQANALIARGWTVNIT